MSGEDSRNKRPARSLPSIHPRNVQCHRHAPLISSASRPQLQTNPSFFPSSVAAAQSHLAIHGLEPQITRGNYDHSASLPRRTSPSRFPVHPLPARFAARPQHTPYDSFPPHFVMPCHPHLFQNQPSHLHAYHGYQPLEPYPPTPLLRYQPQPYSYFQHQSTAQGGDPPYHQAGHFPPPMAQFAISGPGSSHAGSYGGLQQYPPFYSSPGYQFYQGPSSSTDSFVIDPTQLQQRYPISYSHPQIQRPHRNYNALQARSTGSDHLPSHILAPSSSAALTASRNTISSATGEPSEQPSVRSSQNIGTRQLGQQPPDSTAGVQVRRSPRHRYHSNPPPNRSEWVMWMGNIPSNATHDELWRFLNPSALVSSSTEGSSSGAGASGVTSIFLLSRSKCAFVNLQSEEHLNRAISQFSGRKLRPHDRQCPRLVCRARRKEDDLRAGVGVQRGMGVHTGYVKNLLHKCRESLTASEGIASSRDRRSGPFKASDLLASTSNDDKIPKSDAVQGSNHKVPTQSPSSHASTTSSLLARHFPTRFFILKSLTRYDLDLSTKRGVWATQKHNEAILDQAFRTSMEVILIFSVNKSGEFYGYARMASGISRGNRNVSWALRADSLPSTSLPSPSTSCVPTNGSSQQQQSSSCSSELYTLPPETPFVEVSIAPPALSSDETNECSSANSFPPAKSPQEPRLASPALDPALRSDSSSSQGWSQESQRSCPPSALRHESEKQPGVWAGGRSRGGPGTDNSGNLGSRLPPVVEEDQPSQTTILSSAMHGHSEGLEREASWGETFKVEWLCTERVQFHRTRHLRNPWNHGREVKVSRDGMELEPSVGQQLVDSWSSLANKLDSDNDAKRAAGSAIRRNSIQSRDGFS